MTARAASNPVVPGASSTRGLILNLALFQLGWWALVLSAAHGYPGLGLAIVAAILAWHLGFVRPLASEALLIALESRTSSPIQLLRGEDGQSVSHPGLYPCGEGAGFAGGITSAAVDSIRVAEWIARKAGAPVFEPFERRVKAGEVATDY